ncbi:ChrR family anti-sigma-E factor [Variovorax sp. RHLX14]|uniref:ChrR family anti-sigma-E factor n=1 Tax=Variovorax sp. RHLX14 TaxID=1259731 RepID=UPI003F44C2C2
MIQHHPQDEMLLAHAAGSLAAGPALLVASHIEQCSVCRERMALLDAVGGTLLDALAPATLAPDAFVRTLRAIDTIDRNIFGSTSETIGRSSFPSLPSGATWPKAFEGCKVTPWRWLGPGMRWSRVTLPHDSAANVFLLRIGAGKKLPQHTHSEVELTQVLYGSFDDGRSVFGAGDFDEADGSIHHQPVVHAQSECICLASVQGRVMFKGAVARTLGALVGM